MACNTREENAANLAHEETPGAIMLAALQEIADRWPADADPPEEEDYDDTESAYNNGMDVSTWEAAEIARRALKRVAPPATPAPPPRDRAADRIDGYDRDDLGESPDY